MQNSSSKKHTDHSGSVSRSLCSVRKKDTGAKKVVINSGSSASTLTKSKLTDIDEKSKMNPQIKDSKSIDTSKNHQPASHKSEPSTTDKTKPRPKIIALTEPHRMKSKVGHLSKMSNQCHKTEERENRPIRSENPTQSVQDLNSKWSVSVKEQISMDIYSILKLKSPSPQKIIKVYKFLLGFISAFYHGSLEYVGSKHYKTLLIYHVVMYPANNICEVCCTVVLSTKYISYLLDSISKFYFTNNL